MEEEKVEEGIAVLDNSEPQEHGSEDEKGE